LNDFNNFEWWMLNLEKQAISMSGELSIQLAT